MAKNLQVADRLKATLNLATRSFAAELSEGYVTLSEELDELENQARETVQSQIDCQRLIDKLRKAKPLSAEEMNTLRLLIVGDAQYYLKYETDFGHWKNELQRIVGEIGKLDTGNLNVETLMNLRALCREAGRFLPDIIFYLDQKERASKFEEATRGPLDRQSGEFLAGIIEKMVSSSRM